MPKISELFQLNDYCLRQGIFWLQGPGGNTSLKNFKDQTLSIKPSGYRLNQVRSEKDLSQVKLDQFISGFREINSCTDEQEKEKKYKDLIADHNLTPERRPSMETGFHALLKQDFVFHIHSLVAILIADMDKESKKKFKSWYNNHWQKILGDYAEIDAIMPGADLALALQKNSEIPVLFLKNHGAILQFKNTATLENYQSFELSVLKEFFPKAILFRMLTTFPKDLRTGPIQFYFPDFVILFPRLQPLLKRVDDNNYELSEAAEQKDPDAFENWIATQILYHIKPTLKELPSEIIQKVPHLPTELVRKKIMENQ